MRFELHGENKIGYKSLSDADLGISVGNTTHIALYDDILTFLPNRTSIGDDAMFIYNDNLDILPVFFDRIKNPNGTFRSPKIRMGGKNIISVTACIRSLAKTLSTDDITWFLFWFGLKNEQMVFFLFNNLSQEFTDINNLGIRLSQRVGDRLEGSDIRFNALVKYLENKVNKVSKPILVDLEKTVPADTIQVGKRKSRKFDIDKANKIILELGARGEEIINCYLTGLKEKNVISNFIWYNENGESGYPYDFHIEELNGDMVYLDVKTTGYMFDKEMIFSSNEIEFAHQSANNYYIYRVYGVSEGSAKLRVCSNCKSLFSVIKGKIVNFERALTSYATMKSAKLGVSPTNEQLAFAKDIAL